MNGWTYTPLGEVCDVVAGGTPSRKNSKYFDGGIPWVKISDMLQGTITSTDETITKAGIENSAAKVLPSGTVLISIFATIGRTAILGIDAATNQAIVGVIPKQDVKLNRQFLRHCLDNSVYELTKIARGVAQVNINSKILKSLKIPLPPLPEQERIVRLLDEAEALRKLRSQASTRMEDFIPALFHEIFDEEDLPFENLGNVTRRITKGESPGWQGFAYTEEGPLFITSENVLWGEIDISSPKRIPYEFHRKLRRSVLKPNDVLINLVGASIGRCCIVPHNIGDANINQAVAVITPSENLLSDYLCNFLLHAKAQSTLNKGKVESARANISLTDLSKLVIPLPPLDLQREFARRVQEAREIQDKQAKSTERIEALYQSMLSRAFEGEL